MPLFCNYFRWIYGSIEFFMLIILVKVIFEKNRFLYPKNGFFEKIDPKGRPKYSSRDGGSKMFFYGIWKFKTRSYRGRKMEAVPWLWDELSPTQIWLENSKIIAKVMNNMVWLIYNDSNHDSYYDSYHDSYHDAYHDSYYDSYNDSEL